MKTPVQELLDEIWDTGQIINDADYSGGTPSKKVLLRQIQRITGKALAVDRDINTSEGAFYLNQNDLDSIQEFEHNLNQRVTKLEWDMKAMSDRMAAITSHQARQIPGQMTLDYYERNNPLDPYPFKKISC